MKLIWVGPWLGSAWAGEPGPVHDTMSPAAAAVVNACLEATASVAPAPRRPQEESGALDLWRYSLDDEVDALPVDALLARCHMRFELAFQLDQRQPVESDSVGEETRAKQFRDAARRDCEAVAQRARFEPNRAEALEVLARETGLEDASLAQRLDALEQLSAVDGDRAASADLRAALAMDWYRAVWGDLQLTPEQRRELDDIRLKLAQDHDFYSVALARLRQSYLVLLGDTSRSAQLAEVAAALAYALRESSRFDEARQVLEESTEELARRRAPLTSSFLHSVAAIQAELGLTRGAWEWYQEVATVSEKPDLAPTMARILADVIVVSGKTYRSREGWGVDGFKRATWLLDQAFPNGSLHPEMPEVWDLRWQIARSNPEDLANVLIATAASLARDSRWTQQQTRPEVIAVAKARVEQMYVDSLVQLMDEATGQAKEDQLKGKPIPEPAARRAALVLLLYDTYVTRVEAPAELNRIVFERGRALQLLGRSQEAAGAIRQAWVLTPPFELDLSGAQEAVRNGSDAEQVCLQQGEYFEGGRKERARIADAWMRAAVAWAGDPRTFEVPQGGTRPLSDAEEALVQAAGALLAVEADETQRDNARYRVGVTLHRSGRWEDAFKDLHPLVGRPLTSEDVQAVTWAMLDELENLGAWNDLVAFADDATPWVAQRAPGTSALRRLAAARLYALSRVQGPEQLYATLMTLSSSYPDFPLQADDWLEAGHRLLTAQRWVEAAEVFERAAGSKSPSLTRPDLGPIAAADLWFELGEHERSLHVLRQAVAGRPGAGGDPLAIELASRLLAEGHADEARAVLRPRQAKHPKEPALAWWLAASEIQAGAEPEVVLLRARAVVMPTDVSSSAVIGRSVAYLNALHTVAARLDQPYPATRMADGRRIGVQRINAMSQAIAWLKEMSEDGPVDWSLQTQAVADVFDLRFHQLERLAAAPPPTDLRGENQIAFWHAAMTDEIFVRADRLAQEAAYAVDRAQAEGKPHQALRRIALVGHLASCHVSADDPVPYGPVRSPLVPLLPTAITGDLATAAEMSDPGLALLWLRLRRDDRQLSAAEHAVVGVLEFRAGREDSAIEHWLRARGEGDTSLESSCNLAMAALRFSMFDLGNHLLDECMQISPARPDVVQWRSLAADQAASELQMHCPSPNPLSVKAYAVQASTSVETGSFP